MSSPSKALFPDGGPLGKGRRDRGPGAVLGLPRQLCWASHMPHPTPAGTDSFTNPGGSLPKGFQYPPSLQTLGGWGLETQHLFLKKMARTLRGGFQNSDPVSCSLILEYHCFIAFSDCGGLYSNQHFKPVILVLGAYTRPPYFKN